ncbi:MAG TPA: fluoride efflux transporter CrcB [Gemmatimonadaceae bacterium]|jgi:CrcB protein
MIVLLIAIGGAVGSVARYLMGRAVQEALHLNFPTGTFIVNVVGCLVIGVLAKFFLHSQTELPLRATLMIGFCGGFTTFSSFSLETLGLIQGGEWGKATGYVVLSALVCVGATAAGFALGRPLNP